MRLSEISKAKKVVLLILLSNLFILSLKIYLFLMTLSLVVLAYLTDTFIDIMNDSIAFIGLRKAMVPADKDHPYGHGKYEALSRLIISIFVFVSVIEISSQSIERLIIGKGFIFVDFDFLTF